MIYPLMNLLLLCLNSSVFLSTFFPKKYQSPVFYDDRDLKICKCKKSEQYFRDKFEIFVSSMKILLAIVKVTDARRDIILAGGLNHRRSRRPLPPPPPPPPPLLDTYMHIHMFFYLESYAINSISTISK